LPSLHFSVASARILVTKSCDCELHPEPTKSMIARTKTGVDILDLIRTGALFRAR
jgi:hypothetical protein